jgi:hypothetical protein
MAPSGQLGRDQAAGVQEEARAANRGHPLKLLGSAIADQKPVNFKVSRAL